MKILLSTIAVLAVALGGGDREDGLALYRAGKFQEAQAAFARALEASPDSAELQWNLALAAWRAGDLTAAEVAVEKYAASSKQAKAALHRGLLGAVRFAEAVELEQQADAAMAAAPPVNPAPDDLPPADPMLLLQEALDKAKQAKGHFVRGVRAEATPELVRNTERALRKIEELEKRIEELKKQQEQQQQQQDQQQDDQDKSEDDPQQGDKDQQQGDKGEGEQKPEEQQEPQEGQQPPEGSQEQPQEQKPGEGEQQQEQQGEGEGAPETPEPKPNEDPGDKQGESKPQQQQPDGKPSDQPQKPEPKPGEQEPDQQEGDPKPMGAPEPKPGEPRTDAPGEGLEGRELTPEQAKRLLDRLKELDKEMKKARARARTSRKRVERDW